MLHNLISPQYINEIRTSPTFKEDSWAREYCSIWTGGSNQSWFNYDRMSAYRKIVNPETHAKFREDVHSFYILSVDVGRVSCQTVVSVLKVFENLAGFRCNLVNIFVLGKNDNERHFEYQARDLKRLIRDF